MPPQTLSTLNDRAYRRFSHISLLLVTSVCFLGLHLWMTASADRAELIYGRQIFPIVQKGISHVSSLIPFSSAYLIYPALIIYLIAQIIRVKRRGFSPFRVALHIWWGLLLIVSWFYISWGWNYARYSVAHNFDIEVVRPSDQEVRTLYDHTVSEISRLLKTDGLIERPSHSVLIEDGSYIQVIRHTLDVILPDMYVTPSTNPLRAIRPKGLLQGFGASGIYFPLSAESNVDPGLHTLILPFVMAHELSHGAGVTDEGACNYLAFKACLNSGDTFLEYVAYLNLWRYLARDMRRLDASHFEQTYDAMPDQFRQDLYDIRQQFEKYPDYIPALRKLIYDRYLKSHGISDGLRNYRTIITLIISEQRQRTPTTND